MSDNLEVPEWLTAASKRRCGNCQWWVMPDGGDNGSGLRDCRVGPPSTSPVWQDEWGDAPNYWPKTRASNWCGSFRLREGLETEKADG